MALRSNSEFLPGLFIITQAGKVLQQRGPVSGFPLRPFRSWKRHNRSYKTVSEAILEVRMLEVTITCAVQGGLVDLPSLMIILSI